MRAVDLPLVVTAKDFAAAYGVNVSRISQLRTEGVLPPTLGEPGERTLRWDRREVVRFLARQRRDEDNPTLQLPLTLPRAGVRWHLTRRATHTLVAASYSSAPVAVHVMTYRADTRITGCAATIQLATVLAPHSTQELRNRAGADSTLVQLWERLHPDRPWQDRHSHTPERITLLVLDTRDRLQDEAILYDPIYARLHVAETATGAGLPTLEPADPTLVTGGDVAAVLSHPLPLWPHGHATADTVASWTPDGDHTAPVEVAVPPFAEEAHKVLRWTQRAASRYGEAARDVQALGVEMWRTRISPVRDATAGIALPAGWMPAVRWPLPPPTKPDGNMMIGADEVLADPDAPRNIATSVNRFLGDPVGFATVTIQRYSLPDDLRQALSDSVAASPLPVRASWRLFTLQQTLAELAVDPDTVRGTRWLTRPARPDLRPEQHTEPDLVCGVDPDGATYLAVRPPRDLPADLTDGAICDRGVQLWIVSGTAPNSALFLLLTDDGILVPLPVSAHGGAAGAAWWLASAVTGRILPYGPGSRLPVDQPIVDVVEHALAQPWASIEWSRVVRLGQNSANHL